MCIKCDALSKRGIRFCVRSLCKITESSLLTSNSGPSLPGHNTFKCTEITPVEGILFLYYIWYIIKSRLQRLLIFICDKHFDIRLKLLELTFI